MGGKAVQNRVLGSQTAVAAAAAGFTTITETFNMESIQRVRILLTLEQAGAGTATVTLTQSTLADGSDAKALAFEEFFANEVGSGNQFTRTVAATLTAAGPTTGTNVYAFEVLASQLDIDNDFRYVRMNVASLSNNTAAALLYDGYQLRFARGSDGLPDSTT